MPNKADFDTAFFFPSLKVGGGNRAMLALLRQHRDAGGSCGVYYIKRNERSYPLPDGVNWHCAQMNEASLIKIVIAIIKISLKIRKTSSIRYVILSDPMIAIFSFIYSNKGRVRYVQADDANLFRDNDKATGFQKFIYFFMEKCSRVYNYHSVIFNSKSTQLTYLRHGDSRYDSKKNVYPSVFTSGIASRPKYCAPGKCRIGTVGRSHAFKGYKDFLFIVDMLFGIDVEFLAITQEDLPTHDRVNVVKPANDNEYVAALESLDFFISTSKMEGFGLPTLEAMGLGVVCIARQNEGLEEYYEDDNLIVYDDIVSSS